MAPHGPPLPHDPSLPLRYWRSVAELAFDRATGLAGLERCFRDGEPVWALDGEQRGRVLSTTLGHGLDAVAGGLARLWMPWKGKTFDAERKEGRNVFTAAWRLPRRIVWPRYDVEEPAGRGRIATFRFATWSGRSAVMPDVEVFKIDYDLRESPAFLIRSILDEVVRIDERLCLGQALLRRGERFHRVAWFSLEDLGA